jgi:hypothetical protein
MINLKPKQLIGWNLNPLLNLQQLQP